MKSQVEPDHYFDKDYDSKNRFISYWHQINEIMTLATKSMMQRQGKLSNCGITRKSVVRTGRIGVTEQMLRALQMQSVLELGAGDYSFDYLTDISRVSWVKVDFAEPCDIMCDLNTPNLVLPFESERFDTVICTEVIEHLLWPQAVLAECSRILGPEGHIIVSVPNIVSMTCRLRWLLGRLPTCTASGNLPQELGSVAYEQKDGTLIGGHVIDFNVKRITSLMERYRFRVEKIKGCGLIGRRQWLPRWLVPVTYSSYIIILGRKDTR